ncbi:hypothetical protein L6452_25706 [Arctium lappa]|uniref:Uncharacterized protein n=1 Tax=Arctium lappa TaxID=4217 RepID=A0ACB9ABX4_ARCLA|nr:hypothetical protein L6452_25706 [Arctium lappa]
MGTQVLPAQNFLIHQNPAVFHRRQKPFTVNGTTDPKRQTNNNCHRKSNAWRHLQKRTMNRSPSTPELTAKYQKRKQRLPVMTTLNRVKSMDCIENNSGRLWNSPAIHDEWYAGSTFVVSPSPGCLPIPSFFNKKQVSGAIDHGFDDIATKDLRHLLRLA